MTKEWFLLKIIGLELNFSYELEVCYKAGKKIDEKFMKIKIFRAQLFITSR